MPAYDKDVIIVLTCGDTALRKSSVARLMRDGDSYACGKCKNVVKIKERIFPD
jgi:predicted SprT family Zn-dependent metalloprotease